MSDYDVVIVGAGITGAAMALALMPGKLRVAVMDSKPLLTGGALEAGDVHAFDPRVSAITPASRRLFEQLGIWALMPQDRLGPYRNMHVHEADGTASIDFSAADIHAPELGHIIENRVILGALHEGLRQQADSDRLTILTSTTWRDYAPDPGQGARLALDDGSQLSTRLLVAADGANSALRQQAGFRTREWDYEHQAIVTTVRTRDAHGQTARQCFMDEGVLAFLPLADGDNDQHYTSIVWSLQPQRAAALMAMDEAAFCAELSLASAHWLGPVSACAERHSFPLRQRHARQYFDDAVVLVGDAAHSIHPLAGQGANLGLLDVQALARELLGATRAGRELNDPVVLRRYQRARKPHNLAMMAMMEGFKRLYEDQPLPLRWLRNAGMRTVDQWPALKNQLIREAMG